MSSFYERFMTDARRRWRACCAPAGRGCGSSSTSITAVTSSTAAPASSAARGSCRSVWARRTLAAARGHWLKFKNPAAPAVQREAEEDWGKERWR